MKFLRSLSLLLYCVLFTTLIGIAQELRTDDFSGLKYLAKEGQGGNLLILLHGYGSNEADLFSFKDHFQNTTVLSPRGPITYSSTSFSWYDIQFKSAGNHERNMKQAHESIEKIILFIDAMREKYKPTNIIVGGFSQGAIISVELALYHPEKVDGIIGLSGALLEENLKAQPQNVELCKNVHAFYAHGTNDELLPIEKGRRCRDAMKAYHINLTYKEYPVKHHISQQELDDIKVWFRDTF